MNTSAHSTKNPTLGKPNTSENRTIGAVRRGFGLDRFDCTLFGLLVELRTLFRLLVELCTLFGLLIELRTLFRLLNELRTLFGLLVELHTLFRLLVEDRHALHVQIEGNKLEVTVRLLHARLETAA